MTKKTTKERVESAIKSHVGELIAERDMLINRISIIGAELHKLEKIKIFTFYQLTQKLDLSKAGLAKKARRAFDYALCYNYQNLEPFQPITSSSYDNRTCEKPSYFYFDEEDKEQLETFLPRIVNWISSKE